MWLTKSVLFLSSLLFFLMNDEPYRCLIYCAVKLPLNSKHENKIGNLWICRTACSESVWDQQVLQSYIHL